MADRGTASSGPDTAIRDYPRLLRSYQQLLDLTSDLASTFELDTLLEHIVAAARDLTESEASSLLLYDPKTHTLYFEAATSALAGGLGQRTIPADNSIAGWVFTHGETIISHDVLNDERFFREMDALTQFDTRSILGVPLRTKDKVLGVIEAVNKAGGSFADEDVQILESLAAQAAIAIENARLFMQSDLIAEIVHEIRTPLSSLTAAAHLLQRTDLAEDQRGALSETILAEVERLNSISTDFLELARLESGRAHFEFEPIDLGGLVQESLQLVRAQAERKGLTLSTDLASGVAPVMGDRKLLKHLLLNLLTNAIKYNVDDGSVTVVVRSEGPSVVLEVRDTGRGIAPENQARLFERFFRVPTSDDGVRGTGLGLAIARRITEAHDGTIVVESELGVGSNFIVRLPSDGS